MKIRSAQTKDINSLKKLWLDCFGDPLKYVDFYFSNRFCEKYCAVLEIDDEIVGMIHLLPCNIEPDQKAFYWFAAGIRSNRRNQGLFKKFASKVKETVNHLGYQNVCVPASGLEGVYQSLGFSYAYKAVDVTFTKEDIDSGTSTQIIVNVADAQDFQICEHKTGDTVWDDRALKFAISENLYCNGKVLKISRGGKSFVCFAIQKSDRTVLIDYHNMTLEDFKKLSKAIFEVLNCDRLIFRTVGTEKIVGLSDSDLVSDHSKITMTLA